MRALRFLLPIVAAGLLAACGGSDAPSAPDPNAAGSLDHADGAVALQGEVLVLTPKQGGDTVEFELGPEVQAAAVRALATSGSPARVTYRRGTDPLVAASVLPAPELGEGLETFEGQVASVDERELVIDGEGGERTFDISGADEGAFDVAHLQDHADEGEPVIVYYDPEAPEVGVAYEDA